jgi:hypothetical protein
MKYFFKYIIKKEFKNCYHSMHFLYLFKQFNFRICLLINLMLFYQSIYAIYFNLIIIKHKQKQIKNSKKCIIYLINMNMNKFDGVSTFKILFKKSIFNF